MGYTPRQHRAIFAASALMFSLVTSGIIGISVSSAHAAENAIARLNYASLRKRGHCTAALFGPSALLTARHCIEGPNRSDLRAVFGYDRGEWVELRNIKSIHADKKRDLAVLCLDKPSRQKPFELGDTDTLPKLSQANITGYRRSKAHATTTLTCDLQKGKTKVRLECPVEPGMSGSPIRIGGKIIAVMAATGKAFSIGSLAKDLPKHDCE